MKQILKLSLLLLALSLPATATAYDFEVDGIYYNITNSTEKTVAVTYKTLNNNDYSGDVTIPATVTYNGSTYSVSSIGNFAFGNCDGIVSIIIPNSVTAIGNSAFDGCTGLTGIIIPSSVSHIGEIAFFNCYNLASIEVENGNLYYDSRNNCNAIIETSSNTLITGCKNTIVPNDVIAIGGYAFENCSGLTNITIPNSVVSIGEWAFADCTGLTSINLGNSLTTIESQAFRGCNALTSIDLPNSITSIGGDAFSRCSSLTSIDIPTSLRDLSFCVFYGCSSLTDIFIPSNIERIDIGAFSYCPSLTNITVASDNPYFDSRNNCNAIIQKAYTPYNSTSDVILMAGCKNTVIPDSVTEINFAAFAGCTLLDSITIPCSVTNIVEYAFQDCSSLSEINIPSSVTAIAEGAFSGCTSLNNVYCHISDPTAINMGSEVFVRNPQNYAERTLYVPIGSLGVYQTDRKWSQYFGNIVEIDVSPHIAFADANVKAICVQNWDTNGDGELSQLEAAAVTSLNNVFSLDSTITSFDELEYFTGLSSINDYEFNYCTGLTSVTIPNSVTIIGEQAFNECTSLTSLTVPNSITHIGFLAFDGTPWYNNQPDGVIYVGLVAYKYKGTMPVGTSINIKEGTLVIDNDAFWYCNELVNVTIPSSVTTINEGAFRDCSNLTNINIPHSVTNINGFAFCGCTSLSNITIPNSITTIANFAFSETGLINVIIPNSVTTIGSGAFSGCTSLSNITIPNSVTNIEVAAFINCPNVTRITVAENNPRYDSRNTCNAIIETTSNTLITGCNKTVIPNSVTAIGWSAFYGFSGLTSIKIPNSIERIYEEAFQGCNNLTSIICEALIPPTIDYGTFTSYTPTLYVPKVSLETYRSAKIWNQFQTILPIEGNIVNDYLSMEGTTALYGDTIVIPVALTNANDIISFQTDIFLPEGLELLQEDGEYMIDPSERMTNTHSIISNAVSNGAIRVLCYSSNYKPFAGESGDNLFYLTVKVADDAEGDYAVQLRNTLLTTSDFEEIEAPDIATNVYVKSYLLGDANNSRTVTITDVVVTSQYVLEMNPQPFVFEAADVNFDNNITVTDVSRIAWMVLNPDEAKAPMRASVIMDCSDYMSGEGISLATGETRTVSIALNNAMDYTACQLDLRLPEGLTASNFKVTDRAGGHVFDVNTLHNGDIRALCYSPALTAIGGHEGALLTFDVTATAPVTGDIAVDGIELVTTACQTVKPDGFVIGVNNATGVNELATSKTVARVEYFNLAGQQIDRPDSGVTLVVTTYTDGSRTTAKVIR